MSASAIVNSADTICRDFIPGVQADEILVVRLFSNDAIPGVDLTEPDYEEASFVGYAPVEAWDHVRISSDRHTESRIVTTSWQFLHAAELATVHGFYVTLGRQFEPGTLIVAKRFEQPWQGAFDGDWIALQVRLQIVGPSVPGETGVMVSLWAAHSFGKDGKPMLLFHGNDKLLLKRLQGTLDRIARRDTMVLTSTSRSRTNHTPIIPADDPVLVAAFTALQNRATLLLSMQRT